METKEKVTDNYILENEVITETKRKKKSFIKFIHVFESDVNKSPIMKKSKRRKSKSRLGIDQRRIEKKWKESLSYLSLNQQTFSFGLSNL